MPKKKNKRNGPSGSAAVAVEKAPPPAVLSAKAREVKTVLCALGYKTDNEFRAHQAVDAINNSVLEAPRCSEQLKLAARYCAAVAVGCQVKLRDVASKRCSRCNFAQYCSVDCQKKHWKEHKKFCIDLDARKQMLIDQVNGSISGGGVFPTESAELALRAGSHHPGAALTILKIVYEYSEKYAAMFPYVEDVCVALNTLFGRNDVTIELFVQLEQSLGGNIHEENEASREGAKIEMAKTAERLGKVLEVCNDIQKLLVKIIKGVGLARVGASKTCHKTNKELLEYLLRQCSSSDFFHVRSPYDNIPIYLACASECVSNFKFSTAVGAELGKEKCIEILNKIFGLIRNGYLLFEREYCKENLVSAAEIITDDELLKKARFRFAYTFKLRTDQNISSDKYSGIGEWIPTACGERLYEGTYGLYRLSQNLPVLPYDDSIIKKDYDVVMVEQPVIKADNTEQRAQAHKQ